MDDQVIQAAQQLLKSGFDRFSERERRVITAIASRHHVTRNVNEALSESILGESGYLIRSHDSGDLGHSLRSLLVSSSPGSSLTR
jgi:hypothetical protein